MVNYYGVIFNSPEDSLLGLLIFSNQAKAILASKCLLNMTNEYENQVFEDWNKKVDAVINSADFSEVPEIEENEIDDFGYVSVKIAGKQIRPKVVNKEEIPLI